MQRIRLMVCLLIVAVLPTTAWAVTPEDYSYTKELSVTVASGNPTVSKAQPIYLKDGDPSKNTTGVITLDFSLISDSSDIAVFDASGNRLDYEVENLDTSGGTSVIWVYNDWVRDGTVQAQVAYGDGPSDASAPEATWDHSGQHVVFAHHMDESSGTLNDASPNNVDSTSQSGITYGVSGQFGRAIDGDGSNDIVDLGSISQQSSYTLTYWVYARNINDGDFDTTIAINGNNLIHPGVYNGNIRIYHDSTGANTPINSMTWYSHSQVWDGSTVLGFLDGQQQNSFTDASAGNRTTGNRMFYETDNSETTNKWFGDLILDAVRFYSEAKGSGWHQAEFDASKKGGITFFNQSAAVKTKTPLATSDVNFRGVGTETSDTTVSNNGSDTLGLTFQVYNNYSSALEVQNDTPTFSRSPWTKETTHRPDTIPSGETTTWSIPVSTTANPGDVTVDGAVHVVDSDSPDNTLTVSAAQETQTVGVQTLAGLSVVSVSTTQDTYVMRDGVSGDWSDTVQSTLVVENTGGASVTVQADSDDLSWVNDLGERFDTAVIPRSVSPSSVTLSPDESQSFIVKTVLPDSTTNHALGPVRLNVETNEPTATDSNTGENVSDPDGADTNRRIVIYRESNGEVTLRSPGKVVQASIPDGKYPPGTKITTNLNPTSSCIRDANDAIQSDETKELAPGLEESVSEIIPTQEENNSDPTIELSMNYDDTGVRSDEEQNVRLMRLNESTCRWEFPADRRTQSVDVFGNVITTQTDGFSFYQPVITVPVPPGLRNFTVTPNPYKPNDGNPATGEPYDGSAGSGIVFANVPTNTTVEVYTLLGGELVDTGQTDSGGDFHWDVRNEAGQLASSGWYLYKVKDEDDSTVKTGKFAIIR